MINLKTLEEIKHKLIETYKPKEIYIFGSYAWGKPTEESDLDILVVTNEYREEKSYKKAVYGHRALRGLGIAKDIIIETPEQFNKRIKEIPTLEYKIFSEGVKVYESL